MPEKSSEQPEQASAKASIEYVASVLGVSSFMVPIGGYSASDELRNETFAQAEDTHNEDVQNNVAYEGELNSTLAFVVNLETLDVAGRDLFERMVKAMKKDPSEVLLLPLQLGEGSRALDILKAHPREAVVVFGVDSAERLARAEKWFLARWAEPQPGVPTIATHSLSEILARPELKKIVWQHLQLAMQRLKLIT
jgi:hypothetical protein